MRISLKLTTGFLGIAAMVGVAAFLTGRTHREIQQRMERLSRGTIVKASSAADMALTLGAMRIAAHEMVVHRRTSPKAACQDDRPDSETCREVKAIQECQDAFRASLDQIRRISVSLIEWANEEGLSQIADEEQEKTLPLLDRLGQEYEVHCGLVDEFLGLADGKLDEAAQFLEDRLQKHDEEQMLPLIETYRTIANREFTLGIRGAERAMVVKGGQKT